MYHKFSRALVTTLAVVLLLTAFVLSGTNASAAAAPVGAVYTSTNSSAGNAILVFARGSDGRLAQAGTYSTGGLGTGAGLGSEGALALSADGRRLFVVNAGSNDISVLAVSTNGLSLQSRTASGGTNPISLSVHSNLLYVLNAGTPANISGFVISTSGQLSPLAGSTHSLSTATPGPAQVAFNPAGTVLVVTEKTTNRIDTYTVNGNGIASGPEVYASNGSVPFGFAFDIWGHAIVSEAATGALSSYAVAGSGTLSVISPSVPATGQNAACWVVTTPDGRFAYTTNAASATISGYTVTAGGQLRLLNSNGITARTGGKPLDMSISQGEQYLYVFNAGLNAVNLFEIQTNGRLASMGTMAGLPIGGAGLAAW